MINKIREFDRALSKTSLSRSIKIALPKSSGFTLIELLVVVSIIALLSTITLYALQDSRIKARNTAKNNLVLEYVKALELYKSDHGNYPVSSGIICFGYKSSETCFAESFYGSDSITNTMSSYLPGDFSDKKMINSIAGNLAGIYYEYPNSNQTYSLTWVLEENAGCIDKSTETRNFFGNTFCQFELK